MANLPPLVLENVRIIFPNFEGKEDQYNRAGDRNFSIALPADVGEAMARDGWNIKYLRPREDGDVPQAYITVAVSYKVRPPHIYIVTSRGRTALGEHEVEMLDWAEFLNVDVILNPRPWEVGDKSGIKAYLGDLYATIRENELEQKYADVPVSGQTSWRH